MRFTPRSLLIGVAATLATSACGTPPTPPSRPIAAPQRAVEAPPLRAPTWIEDDVEGAARRAREAGALLVVDAWAPWCHTCLSMKHEVLGAPELGAYEGRVVFASIDTDKASSAAFVGRYALEVWPTFFVIDPAKDRVLAVHGGSASLAELQAVLDGALALARDGGGGAFEKALAAGADHYAGRRFAEAAAVYLEAAAMAHPRASEARLGAIRALSEGGDVQGCVDVARRYVDAVAGAAMAADFTYYARDCASKLPVGDERAALLGRVTARLRAITADPPPSATVDDRADALLMLADAERDGGDTEAARAALERAVALLDDAAAAAPTPEAAAVFDYMRMRAYEGAGLPEVAVAMLELRTRQMPDNYEPFARLASVLAKTDPERAPEIYERAIELSYGPRRVRYLEQKAEVHVKLGDMPGVIATRERIIAALEALPPGQADPARLDKARKLLEAAHAEEREVLGPGAPTKPSPAARRGAQPPLKSRAAPPPAK